MTGDDHACSIAATLEVIGDRWTVLILRDVFRGLLGAFQGRLVAAIRELQAAGHLRRDVGPEDVAILLTSLVQGVAIRWTLGARGFVLVPEGLRLFDVQMELLGAKEGACDA